MIPSLDRSAQLKTAATLENLVSRHPELVAAVKKEHWLSANREQYGVNGFGEPMYDILRRGYIGIVTREFEARLYLTPGIQRGFTERDIPSRTDELVVSSSYLNKFNDLLVDLQRFQIENNRIVTAEELMNAMGVPSQPRLCDLELGKLGAEYFLATDKTRPEIFYGGPEPRGIGYVVRKLSVTFCQNPLDKNCSGAESPEEMLARTPRVDLNSPDQLS